MSGTAGNAAVTPRPPNSRKFTGRKRKRSSTSTEIDANLDQNRGKIKQRGENVKMTKQENHWALPMIADLPQPSKTYGKVHGGKLRKRISTSTEIDANLDQDRGSFMEKGKSSK